MVKSSKVEKSEPFIVVIDQRDNRRILRGSKRKVYQVLSKEKITPTEICELTGLGNGRVSQILSSLSNEYLAKEVNLNPLAKKDRRKRYYISLGSVSTSEWKYFLSILIGIFLFLTSLSYLYESIYLQVMSILSGLLSLIYSVWEKVKTIF